MEVERILAGSSDGFVAFDRDFRCTYVNEAAARMLGRSAEQVLGQQARTLFSDPAADRLAEDLEFAMRDRMRVEIEHFDSARARWHEIRVYPIEGGLCVHLVDITARKTAAGALGDRDRCRDEFHAMLAHELRNALASMRLAAEVFRRTTTVEQASLAREAIDRQVATMAQLIDELQGVGCVSRCEFGLQEEPVKLE